MADLKQNAKEETKADFISDSTDPTQEPVKSQTPAQKSSALRLPLVLPQDRTEKTVNGAQPTRSDAPAIFSTTDGAATRALPNGPGPRVTAEEPGRAAATGLPRKASEPQPTHTHAGPGSNETDGAPGFSPEVPPARTKADATPSGDDDSEPDAHGQLSEENPEEAPISQIRSVEGITGRRIWDFVMESSESSSDDYDSVNDLNWDPQKEFMQFLWSDQDEPELERKLDAPLSPGRRRRKYKKDMQIAKISERSPTDDASEYEEILPDTITNNKVSTFRKRPSSQTLVDPSEKYPGGAVEAIKQLILKPPARKNHEANNVLEADVGGKLKQLKSSPLTELSSEDEPSFFPCTKCNVNFKEKKHLHRHMMYHLDGNNQVRHVNVPRPFICRECGRSFRDRNSLLKHMIIHQERREKLMEEIKGLNELKDEGRNARLQCPQCVFGTNCPNTFVQHAKTHEKDKRYYCCEECNHMAVTEHELEAHLYTAHRITRKPQYLMTRKDEGPKERRKLTPGKNHASSLQPFHCKVCPFSTPNRNVLKKHVELIHRQAFSDQRDSSPCYDPGDDCTAPVYEQHKFAGRSQKADAHRLQLKPKLCLEKQAFRKRAQLPFWSNSLADLFKKNKVAQKARKGFGSPPSKWSPGNALNKLSPPLRRGDKQSKLSPQQAERIDVTTGLPYVGDAYDDDDQGYGTILSGSLEKPNPLSSCYKPPKTEKSNSIFYSAYDSDNCQGDSEDSDSRRLAAERSVTRKSPSKRKMSTPFHNTMDKAAHVVLPKHEQIPKKRDSAEAMEVGGYEDPYDFSDYTSEATANFLDSNENKQNPYARNYFIRRQRFPAKEDRGSTRELFEKGCSLESDGIQKLIVKEECIETDVSGEVPEPGTGPGANPFADFDAPPFGAERKSCPYCPALFESGVGLSNHVRGHLHRVGLSYDARHVVSPEQVASQDRRPRIRRKIAGTRRMKKAHKAESQSEHTCPLCGGWFDTKTGLSNHVRGHLKRIGKTVSSTSKSPLCILNEMMQDEEEYRRILQVLNKKRFLSRPFVSQKFASSDGLFLSPTGIPVKIQHVSQDAKPWGQVSSRQDAEGLERRPSENKPGVKGSPSSTLIELLKKRKLDEEMEMGNRSQTARKCLGASPPKERVSMTQPPGVESTWVPEKTELSKKVCVHCNTIFPSAVSLSNHLRAYARRKRAALLEGTTYDCKQKKQRSRPGPKKKMFALPHAADEIYRLTCRFCDLVFEGPLSVQEDWIKHLQRHLMNTGVPRTGAGMVEVTSLPKDLSTPEQQTPPLVTQVAS